MKSFLSISIIFIMLLISCGKEESKLQTFTPEAFAYDLGDSWEVNAIINVKGFGQKENNDSGLFEASLSFSTDLLTPEGKTFENIFSDDVNSSSAEEIMDIPLEAQFGLDSTYSLGKYSVIFNIEDNFSRESITSSVDFELKE